MFNNKKIYKVESDKRVYSDDLDMSDVFVSEILIHIYNHIKLGYKIYYLQCKSKHGFLLNNKELEYLSKVDRSDESLNYFFSENIKLIKCFQKHDLFFLTSLKNLGLLVLIPNLDDSGKYYFNLILGVKKNFNINQFNDLEFKSIFVTSFIELNEFNLCENYISKIFNFENNNFKNCSLSKAEINLWTDKLINKGCEFSELPIQGRRIYKKIIFKLICFHLYWLDGKTQLLDSIFNIDRGYKENILISGENNFQITEFHSHYCLEDLLGYNREYFCFFFWRVYERM